MVRTVRVTLLYTLVSSIWLLSLQFLHQNLQDFVLDTLFILISSVSLYLSVNYWLKQTDKRIGENHAKYEILLEATEDIIFTLDTEQRHTGVYGRWLRNQGFSPATFLNKTSREILGAEAAFVHESANQRALAGESLVYEWESATATIQTRLSPIWDKEQKNVLGLVGIGRDISQQRSIEKELEAYQQSLEELIASRSQELYHSNQRLQAEILEGEKNHQESLFQRHLADSLLEISKILNSTLDLDTIFQAVNETIGRLIPHDNLSFILYEGANTGRVYRFDELDHAAQSLVNIEKEIYLQAIFSTKRVWRSDKVQVTNLLPFASSSNLDGASLSAPIIFEDTVLGSIHLGSNCANVFHEKHEAILAAFASHAAIAIHNAQTYQTGQELAALQERARIARDLHDAVTQTLFSANLLTETLLSLPVDAKMQAILQQLHHLSRGALAEMRALLLELRPQSFENHDLANLLQQLADAFYSRSQIPVTISNEKGLSLSAKQQESIYRIVQEALNNVAKHAKASQVTIELGGDDCGFQVSIEDNGRGFRAKTHEGMGLAIMQERAKQIGAKLEIYSKNQAGTKINVNWSNKND